MVFIIKSFKLNRKNEINSSFPFIMGNQCQSMQT